MENQRIKQALSDKSKYTYPNGVLINKLDIQDQKELDEVEASLTYLRLTNLSLQKLNFSFDLNYYLAIHKYIFQDIYSFAGEINAIHPFREGNGRTLREYLRQLVELLNNYLPLPAYELDYSNVTEEMRYNLIQGSIESMKNFDYSLLEKFFASVLKEKQRENPTMNK